ncbi:MAG: FUSC family protein [Actinobacteria bacterium]|nr:FUSC family protein [Actinomycetota bacterium]MCA1721699.1 FUSC family protein [Actinomycetota bacterium]
MQVRAPLGRSAARTRVAAWACVQCGLAASLAWAFSVHVLGHPRPFFASVAAVVALGLRAGQRLRRSAELAAGVALGVLVGDALVGVIGSGSWQIGVVITVALLIAVAFGGGGLVVTQAGLQAVFVVALPRTPNSGFQRWQDALVGGGFALLVAALLSADPWREARRLRSLYVSELAAVLRDCAAGIRAGSTGEVAAALARGRLLEPVLARWQEALLTGRETTRLSPLRGDRDEFWKGSSQLAVGLTRSSRNLRVLLRRVLAAMQEAQRLPDCLPGLLDQLADAVVLDEEDACAALMELARKLDPVALGATSLAGQVAVGQLRVAVVDLLEGLGLEHDRARNALPALAA